MLDKGMGKELEEPWQMINLQVIRNSGIHTFTTIRVFHKSVVVWDQIGRFGASCSGTSHNPALASQMSGTKT